MLLFILSMWCELLISDRSAFYLYSATLARAYKAMVYLRDVGDVWSDYCDN